MKFRLVEDLQEDLQDRQAEREEVLQQVREKLEQEDFIEQKKMNGIAFSKNIQKDNYTLIAQFYIDTTTYDYSAYISTDENDNTSDYSLKGKFEDIINGASKLVHQLTIL